MPLSKSSSTSSELNDFTETSEGQRIYHVSKSRLMRLVNWMSVLRMYLPIVLFVLLAVFVWQISVEIYTTKSLELLFDKKADVLQLAKDEAFSMGWRFMAVLVLIVWYFTSREKPVYLVDFKVFEAPDRWKCNQEQIMEIMRRKSCFTEESLAFMERMLKQSGVGESTAWPAGILRLLDGKEAATSAEAARDEFEVVVFDVVRQVLESTNTKPKDIDILVVNCSLFSPTPSLCSIIVNEFGLRSDVSSYNLSGMGCSAGVISVELVKNILAARPNSTALVVSTENLTQNLYHGNERGFLLQNILFRCGGAALILSNKWSDAFRARFKLLHCVRTLYVTDESYGAVYETEDSIGERGVRLSKEIVKVAGRAMEMNLTTLGPYVLSLSEQLKTGFWIVARLLAKKSDKMLGTKFGKISPYIPDFKRGIDYFCIHAGGRGVIDGIEKNLQLTPEHVEPSRYALLKYGNTSSSSIWYEMDYIIRNTNVRSGQRVLQIAFGSGFKCNSMVWLCLNQFQPAPLRPATEKPSKEKDQ